MMVAFMMCCDFIRLSCDEKEYVACVNVMFAGGWLHFGIHLLSSHSMVFFGVACLLAKIGKYDSILLRKLLQSYNKSINNVGSGSIFPGRLPWM